MKLYLQHIGFVIVDKPIMAYLPLYEDFVEEQTQGTYFWRIGYDTYSKGGQWLTIPNRKIIKLGFWLRKVGSPTGNVTLTIRKNSDKSLIVSKVWGSAAGISPSETYCEVVFDSPPTINEEVLILAEADWQSIPNYIQPKAATPSLKPDENYVRWTGFTWDYQTTYDCAYRYTYRVETPPPPTPDYENSTLGLLHVRHPALLSGEHRRDGKLLKSWTNLSNLDDEYLTGQVGVDMFSRDELEFATIAGVEYAFRVP